MCFCPPLQAYVGCWLLKVIITVKILSCLCALLINYNYTTVDKNTSKRLYWTITTASKHQYIGHKGKFVPPLQKKQN